MKDEVQESQPLQWPEGWARTRFQDRGLRPAWKKSYSDAVASLAKEMKRLGATEWVITRNDRYSEDSGIAVYFSLTPQDEYGWQEALGFIGEMPTKDQVTRAYQERARKVHPEGPTPDLTAFMALTKHRDNALAWIRGERKIEHEKVIPCDAFKEQRWNINAIRLTIAALRQIERCGSPMMMERAFRGFSKALLTGGSSVEQPVTA